MRRRGERYRQFISHLPMTAYDPPNPIPFLIYYHNLSGSLVTCLVVAWNRVNDDNQ